MRWRPLTFVHRWLGIATGLLFALWFATGMVMHVVPFPSLADRDRLAGLPAIGGGGGPHALAEIVRASGVADADRIRLFRRWDGLVYIVSGPSGFTALQAKDLAPATVRSSEHALTLALAHGGQRGFTTAGASHAAEVRHDQWTVPNGYDGHRPLYRIELGNRSGTELYVSSVTGEIVLETTRAQRLWNYAGSVAHWIYPTVLRRDWVLWDRVVWGVSLLALIAAATGAVLGFMRLRLSPSLTPYRGWHAWHHAAGVGTSLFLLTWIFSGWLSMDHGRLFSTGKPPALEVASIAGSADWVTDGGLGSDAREVEWFRFASRLFRRERIDDETQRLHDVTNGSAEVAELRWLALPDVAAALAKLGLDCRQPFLVAPDDAYALVSQVPRAPVYRSVCGHVWMHVDGATGILLERLDPSRRAYRWLYSALHTFDVPSLRERPAVRSVLILSLCGAGLLFSLTGVVIGWRRLKRSIL